MKSRDAASGEIQSPALGASEERYRSLLNSIDVGFCVIELLFDDDGNPVDFRFLETNPAFEQQSGLSDAVGKRVRTLVPQLVAPSYQRASCLEKTRGNRCTCRPDPPTI